MFVQVVILFAWLTAMQCTAIAKAPLCPYGSATECHEVFRLRHKEIISHAASLVHSAAEQSGGDHNKNSAPVAVNRIQKLIENSKKAQTDAAAAVKDGKASAVKAQEEAEKAEGEIQKHKSPSTASSSRWGGTKTPVFQWDETFIKTAKGYTDSISQKTAVAKKKAGEAVQTAEAALQKPQSTIQLGAGTVEMTAQDYASIEESIKEANDAIAEVKKQADAAEVAAYYLKTMMVSHSVFKTVENITYMSTKSKSLIKDAESGLKEAESFLDKIPRKYVSKVKDFTEPIKALVDPLKQLQSTSERVVNHAKALQTIIAENKERIKDMTSVQEAECAWRRASAAEVLVNKIADPVKSKTPFLNDAIKKGDEAKAKGTTARAGYWIWYYTTATDKDIQEIKDAVAKEKEEERKKKESGVQIQQTPVVNEMSDLLIDIPSTITLPSCNADGREEIQTVNIGATKPGSDPEDSTVSTEGDSQERNATASGASGSNGERKGDQGESFRTEEQSASGGDVSTKEPVDDEGIRPVDSTESNEFSDNDSSKRGPRREGSLDSASTMPSACAYAILTLIIFLVTVQR